MCEPILLGYEEMIQKKISDLGLDHLKNVPIFQPSKHHNYRKYCQQLFEMRQRKGVTYPEAERLAADPSYFAALALKNGDVEGVVTGATMNYADAVRPILKIIGRQKNGVPSGLVIVVLKEQVLFFADATVNIDPSAEELASIAGHAAEVAQAFNIEPRIAMVSFTSFAAEAESPRKMKLAADLVRQKFPHLVVDGEVQADAAVNPKIINRIFPFSDLKKGANILIFSNLDAGNTSYKLLQQLGGATILGPFLMGIRRPANVLQRTCTVDEIVNVVALTALQIQAIREKIRKR
jgi:malate dehydrogenase (oxaloacetate-decarboxylating)(NADP+)